MNQPPMGVDGNYCLCLTGAECKKAHNRIDALEAALRAMLAYFAAGDCGQFADDAPGVRAECARNIKAGVPCHNCPRRWDKARALLGKEGK